MPDLQRADVAPRHTAQGAPSVHSAFRRPYQWTLAALIPLAFGLALCACESHKPTPTPPSPSVKITPGAKLYGEPLGETPLTPLNQIMASPSSYQGKMVKVTGKVRRACSAKGCWMEVSEDDKPGCRVTFKDYGFFVPTDSAGSTATVEGNVVLKKVKASHVEHLEGEGATFKEKNPDGTANEVRLVATGVELVR